MKFQTIKIPFENDEHACVAETKLRPLPNKGGKVKIIENSWNDKYGIKYEYIDGKLVINYYEDYVKTHGIESLVKHLNAIPDDIKVVFETQSTDLTNLLADNLNKHPLNKETIIHGNFLTEYDKSKKIHLKSLPSNAKYTIYDYRSDSEQIIPGGDSQFDYWMLWQSDEDFLEYLSKLDKKTRKREADLKEAVVNFFNAHKKELRKMNAIEKADLVYKWCEKNTKYDSSALKSDGNIKESCRYAQDAWETLKRKKGVCAGRANLMKVLLNNRFLGVDCFCISGKKINLPHEWNVVYDENRQPYYYDLSFGLKRFKGNLETRGYSRIHCDDKPIFRNEPKPIFEEEPKPKKETLAEKKVRQTLKNRKFKPLPRFKKPTKKEEPPKESEVKKQDNFKQQPNQKEPKRLPVGQKNIIDKDGTYRLKREDIPTHLRITYINPRKDPYSNYNLNKPKPEKNKEKVLKK